MPFEEITPRKGAGSSSTFAKQVRCAIYIWKTNIRICTVIGGDIASFVGIVPGGDVRVKMGHGNDLGILHIDKAPKDGRAHYKAQPNGKNDDRNDVRALLTVPPYLQDKINSKQTNLLLCPHMVKDKVIIISMHEDLINKTLEDPIGF